MSLSDIILLYGGFSMTHLFLQMSFGNVESLKLKTISKTKYRVAIIIPEFNENMELFEHCIKSSLGQDYKYPLKVVAIDDGSTSKKTMDNIRTKYGTEENLTIIELPHNVGKRRAQKAGFDKIDNDVDIIVTLDSDTILEKDAISNLVRQFNNKKIGAITGDAYVLHRNTNLLTRLISSRYWVAFNQERAAQSFFGAVMCATGVISAYRSSLIRKLKTEYITQTFRGIECSYGDDRHMTNLVLEKGFKVVFEPSAIGWTDAPKTIKGYLKQQLRWNRSFYREMLITAKMIWNKPKQYPIYMVYDLLMQAVLPLLLLVSIGFMIYRSINISPIYIVAFLGTLFGVSLIRSIYAIARTNDKNFLLFPIYSLIHLFLLTPLRIYALFTLTAKGWGTR